MKKKARIYMRATHEQKRELKRRAKSAGCVSLTEYLTKKCLDDVALPVEKNDE